MLGLEHDTDPAWVDTAARDLPGLLADHAHCELKAAQSALSLLARFAGEHPHLVDPLVALAKEETEHFHQVEKHLEAHEGVLGVPEVDAYVNALTTASRKSRQGEPVLLDRLLISALIEARSAERFHLLAEHLPEPELRSFYAELLASEARHYRLFRDLAEQSFGIDEACARFAALSQQEAEVAAALPLGPTVHG
jgi:tRNA-(ms[2]io[6]A)-hydroxylase